MKIKETIFDAQTNETTVVERDMTAEELAQWETIQAAKAEAARAEAEAQAKRASVAAKLEALGLDADDLKALGL